MAMSRENIFYLLSNIKATAGLDRIWPGYEDIVQQNGVTVSELCVNLRDKTYLSKNGSEEHYHENGSTYYANPSAGLKIKYPGDKLSKIVPIEEILLKDPDFGLGRFRIELGFSITELEKAFSAADERSDVMMNREIELDFDLTNKYGPQGITDLRGRESVLWSFDSSGKVKSVKYSANVTGTRNGAVITVKNGVHTIMPFAGNMDLTNFRNLGSAEWVAVGSAPPGLDTDGGTIPSYGYSPASAPAGTAPAQSYVQPPARSVGSTEQIRAFADAQMRADGGDMKAMNELAMYYWDGTGVAKNVTNAVRLLNQLFKAKYPITGFKKGFLGVWSRK